MAVKPSSAGAQARSEGLTLVSNKLRESERVPVLLFENWIDVPAA